MTNKSPLASIALMGATGVGKSALALDLAGGSGASIVSCDSMQVYRGLDIGTAKPDVQEQASVPHFMIDCVDVSEVFSAARWAKEAKVVIASENVAGRVPLITGGTGLYLRALLEGLHDIPEVDQQIRERLNAQASDMGMSYMHTMLNNVDSTTASRIKPHDSQRILRALGVYESSGIPLSRWHHQSKQSAPEVHCSVFILETSRDLLRESLARRFYAMLDAGWLDEVRMLLAQNVADTHPAMRAVGYRQLLAHLRHECSLEEATDKGITATRRYAKRQQTWFRNQMKDATCGDAALMKKLIAQQGFNIV